MRSTRVDAAYAAGILDGEGCLTVGFNKKSRTYDSRIQVGMTAKALPVLQAMHGTFGGTLRLFREETERWEAAWFWNVSGKAALPLLETALPHLMLKDRQARLLIELERMKPGGRNSWTKKMRERAAAIRATVLGLNRKGPKVKTEPPVPGARFVRDVDGFLMQPRSPDLFDDAAWEPWSGPFGNAGITGDGGFWTLSTSACPNAADGYSAVSLRDVLEPSSPPKYWLSAKAAAGILRRAARRGRGLPPALEAALRAIASPAPSPEPPGGGTGSPASGAR
jgi:hypothetical protein